MRSTAVVAAAADRSYDASASEEVLLDVNQLAEGQPFMALGALSVSADGNLLAYTTDNTGFRQYTLHIKDLRTGEMLPDTAERVGAIVWTPDSAMLFYTVEDEQTKRHDRVLAPCAPLVRERRRAGVRRD